MFFDEEFECKLLIGIFVIIFILIAVFMGIEFKNEYDYKHSQEYYDILEQQKNCDHEYITTSDGHGRTLSVYSKCKKCGKEFH